MLTLKFFIMNIKWELILHVVIGAIIFKLIDVFFLDNMIMGLKDKVAGDN